MSHTDMDKTDIQCYDCLGCGLIKMEPILCDCPATFCMKCENNQGFVVKPYETCETCYGSGRIKNKVIKNSF